MSICVLTCCSILLCGPILSLWRMTGRVCGSLFVAYMRDDDSSSSRQWRRKKIMTAESPNGSERRNDDGEEGIFEHLWTNIFLNNEHLFILQWWWRGSIVWRWWWWYYYCVLIVLVLLTVCIDHDIWLPVIYILLPVVAVVLSASRFLYCICVMCWYCDVVVDDVVGDCWNMVHGTCFYISFVHLFKRKTKDEHLFVHISFIYFLSFIFYLLNISSSRDVLLLCDVERRRRTCLPYYVCS